jgi:putative spermidine/putrescine transport system permease protein
MVALPTRQRPGLWRTLLLAVCIAVFVFLIAPIIVIIPLSFNAEPYFTFTPGMLHLSPDAFSLRWYASFFGDSRWLVATGNSFFVAAASTILATSLGTMASLGLRDERLAGRRFIQALILAPMIVPIIITAAGTYMVFSAVGLVDSLLGLVIAHTVLGVPFVVVTVSASLTGFDRSLERAGLILGAGPWLVFRRITLPLILPGVLAGAVLAFVNSLDEVVVALFITPSPQFYTIPRQMWSGLREQISPTILAVATLWVVLSTLLMLALLGLRRHAERLRVGSIKAG